MRIKEKINAFFSLDEEEAENWDDEITNQRPSTKDPSRTDRIQPFVKQTSSSFSTRKSDTNVVPMAHHSSQKPKIKIVEPRTYSEVKEIADLVLKNYSVILNFRRIEKDQAKKILDFLTGTV